MTRNELNKRYFDWMCQKVCGKNRRYKKLLRCLHSIDFTYTIEMDGNREAEGIDLRYRFAYEKDIDQAIIAAFIDDRPCSVLEMMVALCIHCEEHIMDDPAIGDRTSHWFYEMLQSLGLFDMTDSHYDEDYILEVIDRFLNRDYLPNGQGGLFTVKRPRRDLRTVEIWYQMMWYLCEV